MYEHKTDLIHNLSNALVINRNKYTQNFDRNNATLLKRKSNGNFLRVSLSNLTKI